MKKLNEMTDDEKAEFAKCFDAALLPIFQSIEAALLEIYCCVAKVMTAVANATAAPLDWLFEN